MAPLLLAAGGAWYGSAARGSPKTCETVAADSGTVTPTVIASGTVNPLTMVQVGSFVLGGSGD